MKLYSLSLSIIRANGSVLKQVEVQNLEAIQLTPNPGLHRENAVRCIHVRVIEIGVTIILLSVVAWTVFSLGFPILPVLGTSY